MPDLKFAIEAMQHSPGWVKNIFKMEDPAKFESVRDNNKAIARRTLSKVFLARWIVLETFIKVVMEDNQGKLPSSIRHDWVLFQLHHTDVPITEKPSTLRDPCTHIFGVLSGASIATLTNLDMKYSSQVHAIINVKPFFCVIDEAQFAGEVYMGAFSSGDGKTPCPVLRPLVDYFKEMLLGFRLIVSGTGFSLPLFTEVMSSAVSKVTTRPFVDHFTGNFFEEETQLSYVAHYLPHTYLDSESGKHLKTRIRRWLRGRCVATKVLESQLNRPL